MCLGLCCLSSVFLLHTSLFFSWVHCSDLQLLDETYLWKCKCPSSGSTSNVYHKQSQGGTTKKSLRKRNVNNSLLQKLFYTLALLLTSKRDHETIQWTLHSYISILCFPIHFDFRTRRGTECSGDSAKLYGVVGGGGGGGGPCCCSVSQGC